MKLNDAKKLAKKRVFNYRSKRGFNMETFKSDELKNFVIDLINHGFKVYCCADKDIKTYVFFEKDDNIGYVQSSDFSGLDFSTVHKPCKKAGTGYRINGEPISNPTIDIALATFIVVPTWARHDSKYIVKYENFAEYRKENSILNYKEVTL